MAKLIVLAALFAASAQAQTIGLHVASVHSSGGFNNFNPGVYVRFGGITAGTFRNSIRRQSAYIGYTIETHGRLSFALTAGLVSGYRGNILLAVPSAAYHTAIGNVRLGFVPRPPKGGSASALHLMLEREF